VMATPVTFTFNGCTARNVLHGPNRSGTCERQRDKLRGERLTIARVHQHGKALEEFEVEGRLAFADRYCCALRIAGAVVARSQAAPTVARLRRRTIYWNHRNRVRVQLLRGIRSAKSGVVDLTSASWNRPAIWLKGARCYL
jgi:hypothetical protein